MESSRSRSVMPQSRTAGEPVIAVSTQPTEPPKSDTPPPTATPRPRLPDVGYLLTVAALATAFFVIFYQFALLRYTRFLANAFDMGIASQATWKLHHLRGTFNTVDGLSIFADHVKWMLLPLSLLPPTVPVLLAVQTALLALGVIPVYAMTRPRAGPRLALLLAIVYLLYPSLQYTALYDVHPETFAILPLLCALWALDARRPVVYWVGVAVALTCREDVAIVVGVLGIVLLLERRVRTGVLTVALAGSFLIGDAVIMRVVNSGGLSLLRQRYYWLTAPPGNLFTNLTIHLPSTLERQPLRIQTAIALLGFLLPVLFALAARPSRCWVWIPPLAVNLLTQLPGQKSIFFHYGFLTTAMIFFAASDGLGRLRRLPALPRHATVSVLSIGSAVGIFVGSPFTTAGYHGHWSQPKPAPFQRTVAKSHPAGYVEEARRVVAMVPPRASVAASGQLVPHLTNRDAAWLFPNPFYRVWYAETIDVPLGPDVTPTMPADPPAWVLVDRVHRGPDSDQVRAATLALLPRRYQLVHAGQFFQVWRLAAH